MFSKRLVSSIGMVFVKINSRTRSFTVASRSHTGSENTACVNATVISRAPRLSSRFTASVSEPPVSTSSSTSSTFNPFTSPIRERARASAPTRFFSMNVSGSARLRAQLRPPFAKPRSTVVTTVFSSETLSCT